MKLLYNTAIAAGMYLSITIFKTPENVEQFWNLKLFCLAFNGPRLFVLQMRFFDDRQSFNYIEDKQNVKVVDKFVWSLFAFATKRTSDTSFLVFWKTLAPPVDSKCGIVYNMLYTQRQKTKSMQFNEVFRN